MKNRYIEFADGTKFWYQNNQLHRLDGPAVEFAGGYKGWWQNGRRLSEEEIADLKLRLEIDKEVHNILVEL
jgi:hypothetical protein